MEMDRTLLGGQEIRLSLCTPGASGRSTLAALIAAQGVMLGNKKGLLPEPNLAQLLTSITNPTALQVLLRPYHTGKRGGKYGRHHSLPFLRPPVTSALLTLGKAHQSAMLGNGLVLQNLLHMQLAQQQLMHIKEKRITNGDPSRLLLHKALSLRAPGPVAPGKGLLGDSPTEFVQESAPVPPHNATAAVSATSLMPYKPGRAPAGAEHNGFHSSSSAYSSSSSSSSSAAASSVITFSATNRQPAPPGTTLSVPPHGQSYSLGSNCGLAPPPPPPKDPGGLQALQHASCDGYPPAGAASVQGGSLLGEPPKEVKLPSNPYLNLASVMPGMVLQGPVGSRAQAGQPGPGLYAASSLAPPVTQGSGSLSHGAVVAPGPAQYAADTYGDYSQYSQVYTQEAMQQWYHQYQAAQVQSYNTAVTPESLAPEYSKEQSPAVSSYGEYGSYMQAVTQYYTQPPAASQAYTSKPSIKTRASANNVSGSICCPFPSVVRRQEVSLHAVGPPPATAVIPAYGALPLMPGFLGAVPPAAPPPGPVVQAAATDWSAYYYNQARGQKREYPQLAVQEVTSSESAYIGQHSQGLGGQYADYFKRKRL
ncbi:Ribonucleoprotein PTB-binding 2 [Merluccius polli]|uniref:Ribonucleoprotein PTB-binding 2 n=1 Tax=Merluccius polli TaxID=89951 RepID=A0AA47NAC9_MERPO|nr:Ribonucleoprotein PTB-binding 2 [Merluccius polli]